MCTLFQLPGAKNAFFGSVESLVKEVDFRPYYHWTFHFDNTYHILFHLLRAAWNTLLATYNLLNAFLNPLSWINPLEWVALPIAFSLHAVTAIVSLAAAVIQPVFFAIRSIMSLCCGYAEEESQREWFKQSDWEWGMSYEEAEHDHNVTTRVFAPSSEEIFDDAPAMA